MNEQQKAGGDAGAPGLADGHRPGLSAMRRFSTENTKTPLTMSLRDLPKPSFNMGPPGQRSVPATSSTLLRNPVERGAYTPGTLTPGAGGDMGMGEQPWNLFPNEEEKRGSGAQHPRAGNDPSTWSARSKQPSAWNDDRTPVTVGSNLASSAGPMAPQTSDPRSALSRSTSYTGGMSSGSHRAFDGQQQRQTSGLGAGGRSHVDGSNASSDAPHASVVSSSPVAGTTGAAPSLGTTTAAANSNNMPFDLAAGMADMSLSAGMPGASQTVPSGFDRGAGLHHPQGPPPQGPWPPAASMAGQTWGAPAAKQPGFNMGDAGSPYNSYYGFNPLGAGGAGAAGSEYGPSAADPGAFDPYRRDSAYGSGVASPLDMGLLGGPAAGAPPQQPQGRRGWQMNDRSPSRSPTHAFGNPMSASRAGASPFAGGRPDLMYPSAAAAAATAAQMQQQQFFNPAAAMPPNRSMGFGGHAARLQASGYPEQLDYSAYGGSPYLGGGYNDAYQGMPGASRYEDRARGMRSPLLEEFRANRHRRWDLSDLRGHIVEFSGDQLGSRHLQTKLDTATVEERRIFFEEAMPHVLTLSTDLFSNYVVQKAFEISDHKQKLDLVHALEGHILQLSLQTYGCRVVQKAIESVMVDEQVLIVNELRGSVLKCARDQNANHVLQRILERVPADRVRFIAEACEGQVHSLATHPYGCRVLQRILENTSDVRPLIDELLNYTKTLMQDQYANYVCQHLLERGTKADRAAIIEQVSGNLVNLSRHKFASNVIDKVILCADEDERRLLMDEVLTEPNAVNDMLRDQFANYCLQKFMLVIQGPQRQMLMDRVAESLMQIRKYSGTFSKHLIAIEKFIANEQALAAYNTAAVAGMR